MRLNLQLPSETNEQKEELKYRTYHTANLMDLIVKSVWAYPAQQNLRNISDEYASYINSIEPDCGFVVMRGETDYLPNGKEGRFTSFSPEVREKILEFRHRSWEIENRIEDPLYELINAAVLPFVNPRVLYELSPSTYKERIESILTYTSMSRFSIISPNIKEWADLDSPIWDERIKKLKNEHYEAIKIINEQATLALLLE